MATKQQVDQLQASVNKVATQVTAVQTAVSNEATAVSNEIARVSGDLTSLRDQIANGQVPDDATLAALQASLDTASQKLSDSVDTINQHSQQLDAVDVPAPTASEPSASSTPSDSNTPSSTDTAAPAAGSDSSAPAAGQDQGGATS